jgi:DNA-binding transcriptional regulator YiaG
MAPPRKYRQNAQGRAFEAMMKDAGMTQEEASDALGIDVRTVRRYIVGEDCPEPTLRLLRAIVRFNIDPEDLL